MKAIKILIQKESPIVQDLILAIFSLRYIVIFMVAVSVAEFFCVGF